MACLYIEQLSLSHFRSHKTAHLEFDGRPVAIWGANGVGKTNILEAVSMLSPGRGMRRLASEHLAYKPDNIGWKIKANLQTKNQFHELETWAETSKSRNVRIDGKLGPQVALARLSRVIWLVPAMDRLWIEGAEGRRRFFDRLVMSFEPAHADAILSYEKSMRERNRLLKEGVRDSHWYRALEVNMAQKGALIMRYRMEVLARISVAQNEVHGDFPRADLSLSSSDAMALPESEADLMAAFSDNRMRDLAAGRTLIGPHRADIHAIYKAKGIAADQASTGEQKALLISMILANGRALSAETGEAPIYLLDEVAAHLDVNRRGALYDEICSLKAQAFMTGTEADLFSDLKDRAMKFELTQTQINRAP